MAWGLALFLAASAGAAETVKVATFNCEFLVRSRVHIKYGLPFNLTGDAKNEWDQPGFRDAKFKEAADVVAAVVRRIDADVIALVEVGDEADVEELRLAVKALGLDYPHKAVCESADVTTGQHVAVLSKRPLTKVVKTIPGRESYLREPDDPDTEDDTGVSKGLHVVFEVGGRPVHLFVVHLASERGGHEQDAQRIAQASIVRRNSLEPLNKGEHVIVAGDLNDHRGQPALRRIRGLDDLWEDLIQTGGPVFNRPKAKETPTEYNARLREHWTYEFEGQRQQIDHILISQSLKRACTRGREVRIDISFIPVTEKIPGTDHPVSDHRAVMVTFEFQ
jgi:endonuclease/exonuclease/phosphatase family metal-dependent hydrolase